MKLRVEAERLEKLYAKIPTFECIPGCTDCCGPVPFSRMEWARIEVKKTASCLECPFIAGGCEVYEDRPFMCRLFGASEEPALTCPHGCGPEVPLTAKETLAMTEEYIALTARAGMVNPWDAGDPAPFL